MENKQHYGADIFSEPKEACSSEYPKILLSGDSALLVEFGNAINANLNQQATDFAARLREEKTNVFTDIVPAFCSVYIEYDALEAGYDEVREIVQRNLYKKTGTRIKEKKTIEIPVCYGGIYGEDLPFVVKHAGLTVQQVVDIHSSRDYLIYMLGFMPGFPYLGGLDPRIFTPRLQTPRLKIPAGSVGIGGEQTGIYPLGSPGGWQLIGRTPLRPYRPDREPPIAYEAGNYIHFVPVSEKEYQLIQKDDENETYQYKITKGD